MTMHENLNQLQCESLHEYKQCASWAGYLPYRHLDDAIINNDQDKVVIFVSDTAPEHPVLLKFIEDGSTLVAYERKKEQVRLLVKDNSVTRAWKNGKELEQETDIRGDIKVATTCLCSGYFKSYNQGTTYYVTHARGRFEVTTVSDPR